MSAEFNILLNKLIKSSDIEQKCEIILEIITYLRYLNEVELTKKYCNELLDIAEYLQSDYLFARVYDAYSAMYFYIESFDKSLHYAFKSLEINERKQFFEQCSVNAHLIGLIYMFLEDYVNAESFFLKSVKFNPQFINVYCNLIRLYCIKDDLKKAQMYLNKALSMIDSDIKQDLKCFVYYNKAFFEEKTNQIDIAQKTINLCWSLIDKEKDKYLNINLCNLQALVLLKQTNYVSAKKFLDEAEFLSTKQNRNVLLLSTWRIMSKLFAFTEDYKKACYFHKLSVDLKSKIFNIQISEKYLLLRTEYEAEIEKLKMLELIAQSTEPSSVSIVTGGIIHEINQPLSAIKVYNDSILYWSRRHPCEIPDFILNQLINIGSTIDNISNLMNQIKNFWKNSLSIQECKHINVREMFNKVLKLYKRKLHSHSISYEIIDYYNNNAGGYFEKTDFDNIEDLSLVKILETTGVYSVKNIATQYNNRAVIYFYPVMLEQIFSYIINIISDLCNLKKEKTTHFFIRFEYEIDFVIIRFEFDSDLYSLFCSKSENEILKSLQIDFKIVTYFIEKYHGLLDFKSNNQCTSFLKVTFPADFSKDI